MIKRGFWEISMPETNQIVRTDHDELIRNLGLDHERFAATPGIQNLVFAYLDRTNWSDEKYNGRGFVYYPNPEDEQEEPHNAASAKNRGYGYENGDEEEEAYPERPDLVAFAECDFPRDKRGFALVIRQNEPGFPNQGSALIFGMHGTYDNNGRLLIDWILMPTKDFKGNITPVKPIDVNTRTVRQALAYAKFCVEEIYEDRECHPAECLSMALQPDAGRQTFKILPPAP